MFTHHLGQLLRDHDGLSDVWYLVRLRDFTVVLFGWLRAKSVPSLIVVLFDDNIFKQQYNFLIFFLERTSPNSMKRMSVVIFFLDTVN